jgi:hypothetical protein
VGDLWAQQLVTAGGEVIDVPAMLAARVRVLGSGRSNKNDPYDSRSVAIAAMRAPGGGAAGRSCRGAAVVGETEPGPGPGTNRVACRLHALLCELEAGGISRELTVGKAERGCCWVRCRQLNGAEWFAYL